MQEPSYLGKIALVSIWFRMVFTQIITRIQKDSLTFAYPPNINIQLGSQILIPTGRFFTIIDVDY